MALNLDWVEPHHQERAQALIPHLTQACEKAEKSARFIQMQLNPRAEWRGWPSEVAEDWIARRPVALLNYLDGSKGPDSVSKALLARMQDVYRPPTGNGMGRPPREPVPGLDIPEAVSKALDTTTWGVLWKSGGTPDQSGFVQAAKVAATRDSDDEKAAQILSVGTVQGKPRKARYMSINGDLYWSDIRNSLELWIRARPELVADYVAWDAAGRPRAWQEGGKWLPAGNGRVEHNPLVRIKTTAWIRGMDIITEWRKEGTVSLDALYEDGGDDAVALAVKPVVERVQHAREPRERHYAWGLRDSVDCYNFPVEHLAPNQKY